MNYPTADRPLCMLRDEFYHYHRQNRQQQPRKYRKFDYIGDDDFDDDFYWNMSYNQSSRYNGSSVSSGKSSHSKGRNAHERSSSSGGFQSFFRWFKKDDKNRSNSKDIRYPRELTSSTDTLDDYDHQHQSLRNPPIQFRKKIRGHNHSNSPPPPPPPRRSYAFSQSSSCDSIFSTASSFAFVPPIKYLLNRNQQRQTEKRIIDSPYTESYQKRVRARDRMREIDKQNEITLRKKYHLYAESSDAELNYNNNNSQILNHNHQQPQPSTSRNNKIYQDLSLPTNNATKRDSNVTDSVKLEDLNSVSHHHHHRRTSSDSSKDKRSGAFVHVKNKKRAPLPPPLDLRETSITPKTLSGRRRKRQAPAPPISPTTKALEEATSATSLLGDKEIQAIIQGKTSLVKNTTTLSSPIVSTALESPIMEKKKIYVSPYLKIREDRKLTDEQKRILLEQVTKNQYGNDGKITPTNCINHNMNSVENGQSSSAVISYSPMLTKDDREKVFAPSSPISPRPWYKRSSTNSNHKETIPFKKEVLLRTLEKKKNKKEEKDLPEVGYSRNSFFDTASKFNIFAKLGEDNKKKEREVEKRKSLIGIPNISELDREAAEIIQRGEASKITTLRITESRSSPEKNESPKAKDLIQKFEASSAQINKISVVNTDFAGRDDLFGGKSKFSFDAKDIKDMENQSKAAARIESNGGVKKQQDGLLGLWKCSYCTIDNPNWKIICEACGKIKPYEKRFLVNGDVKKESPLPVRKFSYDNPKASNSELGWEKKSEIVKKYFQSQIQKPMDLAKSPSESFIGNSFSSKKSPSPTRRYLGSPKLPPRKLSIEKPIKEEPVVKSTAIIPSQYQQNDKDKSTPDLNALRNARLARFKTSLEIKRNQNEIEKQNAISTNRKQSPEKKFPEKLDFSDPIALEREKERLREKIRAMNTRALNDKYPIASKDPPNQPQQQQHENGVNLGAIKKVFKKSIESNELINGDEEKIINSDIKTNNSPAKREKISISVQTPPLRKKSEDFTFMPMSVVEFDKNITKTDDIKTVDGEKENVYASNTFAINKILRKLESAIADGKHDEAAKFAKDLAKLKVPLSVRRQNRPKSDMELQMSKLKTWLCIKEDYREMEINCYEISPHMTIDELKNQISKEYYVPIQKQRISINGVVYDDGKSILKDLEFATSDDIKIYVNVKKNNKNESDSDDEIQNEKVDSGAVGGIKPIVKTAIDDKGWECPLCTLINLPSHFECLACSTKKPKSLKESPKLKEIEYHLRVNEDLRTFFERDKVDLRPKENGNNARNDLDRNSGNRKSSDLFNILVEDKEIIQTLNPIVMTASIPSPNITKNKYRGVENFNPFNKSYLFPKLEATNNSNNNDVRKPIITNVIYKSTNQKLPTKERKSHYQELVNLEISDVITNQEQFECTICFSEIESNGGVCLRDCLHTFCKTCLENHIKYSEEAEIKCPFINEVYSCQSLLQEREIRGLVSQEEYEKHLSRSIRLAENKIENTFHCKTPNCKGWCIFEDNTNSFKCPVCTIVNCITCGAIHDGLNCKEYQDHLGMSSDSDAESAAQTKKMLQELIEKNEAMNCPTCHIFLLKKWGCDWLKCSFCKTEICWVTKQPRWGPGGKGDFSGGCKCGLNNKKCSPRCTYCH